MKLSILVLFILLLMPTKSLPSDKDELLFNGGISVLVASEDEFYIEISDGVTGGCLPYPRRLVDSLEISLRKNGFKIINKDEAFLPSLIGIVASGLDTGGGYCVVHVNIFLTFWASAFVPNSGGTPYGTKTLVPIRYTLGGNLLGGDKHSMQDRLEQTVRSYGDELFLYISRSRDDVKKRFPSLLER